MHSSSGGASSNIDQTRIDALMTELNADFAAYNMIFCADPANFNVDDPNYNHNENTEEVSLKTTYVTNPTQYINIYVVGSMGPGGYARFPYDPMGGTSNTCINGFHIKAQYPKQIFWRFFIQEWRCINSLTWS